MTPGRRVRVDALGADPADAVARHLRIEAQEPPSPGSLSPGEALVRVRAANVGWVDLLMMSGQYQHVPTPPYTPGLEYAGEVLAIGGAERSGPGGLCVGDLVFADGLETGPRSLGAWRSEGGFATYARAPLGALHRVPEGWSAEEGACFLAGAETAWHALVLRANVQPGETVLLLGATGSTGLAAVRVAKLRGARVLAVGRSEAKLAAATACGADEVIRIGEGTPTLREQVKAHTGGRGADVVVDAVGGPLSVEGLRAAAFGARFVLVGWAGTPDVARGGRDANVLPTNLLLMKGIDVLGSPAAIAAHRDPVLRARRLAAVLEHASSLRPWVGARYPIDEVREALTVKWQGRAPGNVVLTPG